MKQGKLEGMIKSVKMRIEWEQEKHRKMHERD